MVFPPYEAVRPLGGLGGVGGDPRRPAHGVDHQLGQGPLADGRLVPLVVPDAPDQLDHVVRGLGERLAYPQRRRPNG